MARTVQAPEDPYMMQHRVLPRLLFGKEGNEFFAQLMQGDFTALRDTVARTQGTTYAEGMRIKINRNPDIVFITFPEPARMPLCYHVALVKTADGFRYLTLEKTEDLLGQGIFACFCEWTPNGQHMNGGPRTYKSLTEFEREILAQLKE